MIHIPATGYFDDAGIAPVLTVGGGRGNSDQVEVWIRLRDTVEGVDAYAWFPAALVQSAISAAIDASPNKIGNTLA